MATSSHEVDKTKKYDRQLRLWGEHGQTSLESCQVCLINATATGTEILKSASDHSRLSMEIKLPEKMLEINKDSIGKNRGQIATQLLLELNSDVRGDFVDETPEQLLQNNSVFFNSYSVVIATSLKESTLLNLAAYLWEVNIPLLVCRTFGFIGYVRLQVREHSVVESHPDNAHEDLRLDQPFPDLIDYVNNMDFSTMSKKEHSHTPYIVILLKYLDVWKKSHNNNLPKSYKEKDEFRELIKAGMLRNELGIPEEEDNFDEAIKVVNAVLVPTKIPGASKPFWVMARALKDFVENEGNGALPLRGSIPDMTADSERYISLQNIYKNEANKHTEIIFRKVQQLLLNIGKPQDYITEADIKMFCKNSAFLRVIKGRSVAEEYNTKTAKVQDIVMHLDNPDSEIVFYVLLRAVDRFHLEYSRYPGCFNDEVEPDIIKLKTCLSAVLHDWGCGPIAKDDFVHEMCRYGAAELHSMAAFVGGCSSQEVIKLVTNQYVPLNNTYIFNAMTGTSSTFEL
uniref:NEDD8-activating enzyme E1 regulatory subunit n=1 Tax=Strigamia maritima TaxID=126957 RepID=T1JKN5_STRMM